MGRSSSDSGQLELCPPDSPVPPGETPSWFTSLGWWLGKEKEWIAEGILPPGGFTLDPNGHAEAPVCRELARRGGRFFALPQDGYLEDWAGEAGWFNPGYSAEALERACASATGQAPRMQALVALLPAWTDRAWWHHWIEPPRRRGELRVDFLPGRLKFGWPGNPGGMGGDTATFASALVFFRRWRL